MITIAQLWQDFLTTTYSSNLHVMSPTQRRELRLNFYTGFYKALMTLAELGKANDAERTSQMVQQYIDEWQQLAADYLKERQGEQ